MNNKEKVSTLLNAVNAHDLKKVKELVHPNYIQHNPFIPTGREGFMGLFPVLKEHNTQVKTLRLIEDGNYVAAHNLWDNATPFGAKEMVAFDVFRIDGDGLIAEHWDAMMVNTPPNPSGRTLLDGETKIKDLEKTDANKAQLTSLFNVLINGSQQEVGQAIMENLHPNFKQHNPYAADGIEGFMAAMPTEQWVFLKQHKVIGEGNFVLSIAEGTHKGIPSIYYDLIRLENGKNVEHWDVIQNIPTENLANNNTMFNF